MDVNKHVFGATLLPILRAIADAKIVAIDLEMSGIGDTQRRGGQKPSLQAHYDETRKAAMAYTIVQMGITTLEPDGTRGYKVTGIYNVSVDPLVSEANKIGIDRDVTFSSASVHFLQSHGFDLGACVRDGVTYLSRQEVSRAIVDFDDRQFRLANTTDSLDGIDPLDHETLAFVRGIKKEIETWTADLAAGTTTKKNIDIPITGGTQSRYHKKVVYDLLRAQFPAYRAFQSHGATFMTIEKIDPEREARFAAGRKLVFEAALKKETGFRWVIEALCGGDISGIDPSWFAVSLAENSGWIDSEKIKRELQEIGKKIKDKGARMLVGHNLFTDLAFVYQTFIGDLPLSVFDFKAAIIDLFPNVFDTKFIATSIDHAGYNDSSSLQELSVKYSNNAKPVINIPEEFKSYTENQKLHEAGYDAWICAKSFVRMVYSMQQYDGEAQHRPTTFDPMTGLEPYATVLARRAAQTSLLHDIKHDWYKTYVNKLRVFRCEENVCDLAAGPVYDPQHQPYHTSAPHHFFGGPSMDVRNYPPPPPSQAPQQPPQSFEYFGQHQAPFPLGPGQHAGPYQAGYQNHLGGGQGQQYGQQQPYQGYQGYPGGHRGGFGGGGGYFSEY